jgi:hypothetical protein
MIRNLPKLPKDTTTVEPTEHQILLSKMFGWTYSNDCYFEKGAKIGWFTADGSWHWE